jgi:hypothetical protein
VQAELKKLLRQRAARRREGAELLHAQADFESKVIRLMDEDDVETVGDLPSDLVALLTKDG